ncbi:uncharacterized protein LOC126907965 isoform X2 [Daktulosphaira vitifoliae]|uniref:uncharacterized protein LOC126907965 isoform X2 n=1 Tax=Daktulosphaira vitifoliae TaxID=58002 RepID=UPI0021A9F696|nr:uncharacterized protein LOC126907965 isoform X2 [Daktulosphaira vitifoliae]
MSLFIINENTNFEHIIGILFNNWTALKLAIDHGMGGSLEMTHFKITDLIKNIHDFLQKSGNESCWTGVSDIIEDVMDVGFDVVLEDLSADDLGKHICKVYCDWNQSIQSRLHVIEELRSMPITIPIQVLPIKPSQSKNKKRIVKDILMISLLRT